MQFDIDPKPSAEHRAVARRQALEVAGLLNSKAVSHGKVFLLDSKWFYRVPLHTGEFWFKVLVSERDFQVIGEHRRRDAFEVPFCACLKHSWVNLECIKQLPFVSRALGVAVYTQAERTETEIAASLLTPDVLSVLTRIDMAPVYHFFINSIQINVKSEMVSPHHCASQAKLLRELLLTIYDQDHGSQSSEPSK